MWILYQLLVIALLVLGGPFLLLRRGRHYLPTLRGRLGGHDGHRVRNPLWLHAVSVGEVGVAATLARGLEGELLVTTVTPTGQDRARALFAERGAVAYLPFELEFAVGRFFDRFRPRSLVLIEGDLWPLVLRRCQRAGMPVFAVNARMSDRTFRHWSRVKPVARWLYSKVDCFGLQTEQDRQRLLDLGLPAERLVTTGNLKFETPEPEPIVELEQLLHGLAAGRDILVAGSTMEGEESALFASLRKMPRRDPEGRPLPVPFLVIAPRHPERWDEVAKAAGRAGLEVLRRSRLPTRQAHESPPAVRSASTPPDVVLLESLGELGAIYRIAQAAFIGGTLAPTGGHNPLEAARFGVPVLVGPSMDNFREIAELFDNRQAWQRVHTTDELMEVWLRWQHHPDLAEDIARRGQQLIETNRGALARTLELLAPLLATETGDHRDRKSPARFAEERT